MSTSDEGGDRGRRAVRKLSSDYMKLLPEKRFEHVLGMIEDPAKREAARAEFEQRRLFFKLERADYEYEFEGERVSLEGYYNFERGDAVAVLPFDSLKDEVILVEQARPAVLDKTAGAGGWLIEAVAGMPREDDAVEGDDFTGLRNCAMRELMEETEIDIRDDPERLWPMVETEGGDRARFFPSPGGSSEEIHIFLADVSGKGPKAEIAGSVAENERIRIARYPTDTFFELADAGHFRDSKIYAAALLLRHYFELRRKETQEPPRVWRFDGAAERTVELRPGDIQQYRGGFDVWANSEDPTLAMNRMTARSISSIIRRNGAIWFRTDGKEKWVRLLEDTIALALAEEKRKERRRLGRDPELGDVLLTTSGNLLLSHDVRRIAHVVAVENLPGGGQKAHVERTAEFVVRLLERIDAWSREAAEGWLRLQPTKPLGSVLLPFFGAGTADGDMKRVAAGLVEGVRAYWSDPKNAESAISKIGFSCFTSAHYEEAMRCLRRAGGFEQVGAPEAGR